MVKSALQHSDKDQLLLLFYMLTPPSVSALIIPTTHNQPKREVFREGRTTRESRSPNVSDSA